MRVFFRKQIHCGFTAVSPQDVWMWREFDLPVEVLPLLQPGNDFQAGDFEASITGVTVKTEPELHLDIWTPSDDTLYHPNYGLASQINREVLEERTRFWIEAGWMVKHEA